MRAPNSIRLISLAALIAVATPAIGASQTPADDPGVGPVLARLKEKDSGMEKVLAGVTDLKQVRAVCIR